LNWSVKNQPAAATYLIQRSRNGSAYETIGTVAGTSDTTLSSYNFSDNTPYSSSNFYKVVLRSQSGSHTPSQSVAIYSYKKTFFVNGMRMIQTRDKVVVEINSEFAYTMNVSVAGVNGAFKKISAFPIQRGSNTVAISLTNISRGLNFLQFSNGTESETIRLFKQ
jgi:hypothetical protein